MDKFDRLFDAVEHPDRYSDAEFEAMFQDPETRDVYNLMSKAKDSFAPVSDVDIDAEWQDFERDNFRTTPRFAVFFSRHAAAVIIGILATLAALAAGIGISVSLNREEPKVIITETLNSTPKTFSQDNYDEPAAEAIEAAPEIIVFKEETLEKILNDMSVYYKVKLTFKNEDAMSLRLHLKWDQSKLLKDVVEMLNNFEQIKITLKDNTLIVE